MSKQNMYFFFNNKLLPEGLTKSKNDEDIIRLLEEKKDRKYTNELKKDPQEIKGYIHYISAAYHAVKDTEGVGFVLGACDGFGKSYRGNLKDDFGVDITWADFNKTDDSDTILKKIWLFRYKCGLKSA